MFAIRTTIAALVLFLVACPASIRAAETPSSAPSTPPSTAPTRQQVYDTAQAAFDRGDWPAAIVGLASLAKPDKDGKLSTAQGVIHARLARAYAHQSEVDAARRELHYALMGLAPNDYFERALLWLALGEAQRFELAIPEATVAYEHGLEAAQSAKSEELSANARIGLALCYMTLDPAKAKTLVDAVLASPSVATYPKPLVAQLNDLRGRASLNLGQANEAMPFLTKAVKLSGGLNGEKVNLIQIGIRGDAAIGAMLTKHADAAHEYLAWAGAGHLPSEDWAVGLGDPPVCSEAADIRPDDMAVVEFSIGADGHVIGAAPIYTTRPGALGIAFAQAVREWSWNPARLANLSPFWRHTLRVEMRCIGRPSPRQLADAFWRETVEWLSKQALSLEDLAPLRRAYIERDDPRLNREDLNAIPALLARLPTEFDHKRALSIAQHLSAALAKAKAPAAARALAMTMEPFESQLSSWYAARSRLRASQLASMEQSDPHSAATAWLTLEYAIALEVNGQFPEARPVLERVLAYPLDVLGEHDPVRAVATLHLAALERRAGGTASADAKVKAAGLTRAQCLLFDVRPVADKASMTGGNFPDEAQRWGFDGLVREAFDINADGHVENVRTIVAYPPFVFRPSAESAAARLRYLAPVVDGSAAGCDGHAINVKYISTR